MKTMKIDIEEVLSWVKETNSVEMVDKIVSKINERVGKEKLTYCNLKIKYALIEEEASILRKGIHDLVSQAGDLQHKLNNVIHEGLQTKETIHKTKSFPHLTKSDLEQVGKIVPKIIELGKDHIENIDELEQLMLLI